jgi:hypothetical protein
VAVIGNTMLTQALSAAAVPPLAHAAALSSTGMIVGRWPGAISTPEPCTVSPVPLASTLTALAHAAPTSIAGETR